MTEDWVRLQLRMRLQLDVLRYTEIQNCAFQISDVQILKQNFGAVNTLMSTKLVFPDSRVVYNFSWYLKFLPSCLDKLMTIT